jgi:F-type H+-transporting ATPase subunit delta
MDDVTHAQTLAGYATALLAVARAEGDADGIADELFRVAQAFAGSDELRDTLSDPRVPTDRKLGVVSDLLGTRASATTISLVEMLVSTGRIGDFSAIAAEMTELVAAAEEQVVAEVRSAVPLDADTVERLAAQLSATTGKAVSVRTVVDPSVIGGIVARVGDTVFDGSVRNRLQELREAWG